MDSNRKKRASEWFYQTLYREEQILPRQGPSAESVPEEIRAMRALESGAEAWRQTREAIFVRQARSMSDYEDDFVYDRDVLRYYPTYQSLTDRELRGYFGWRTRWRRGEHAKTNLSYAFLYIYELLNQVGVCDPVDGYEKLRSFEREYGALDDGVCAYLKRWLWDYVIYYRLDPVLLEDRPELNFDRQLSILKDLTKHSDTEIFDAVMPLSSYRLERSKLYLKEPDPLCAVTARVLRKVSEHYGSYRKQSWTEDYFGPQTFHPVEMFNAAVFDLDARRENFDYVIDPLRSYSCRGGRWMVREPDAPIARSKKLGDLLRTIDSMLRDYTGIGNAIQPGLSVKWIVKTIDEEIRGYFREKEEEEARKIRIDFSRLSEIRRDASVTRDRLIVDEEREPEEPPTPIEEPVSEAEEEILSEKERRLLHGLLYGGEFRWIQEEGLLLSVLADSINEKLFDRFGDNVLLLDAQPELIEDYVDDLKEMIKP